MKDSSRDTEWIYICMQVGYINKGYFPLYYVTCNWSAWPTSVGCKRTDTSVILTSNEKRDWIKVSSTVLLDGNRKEVLHSGGRPFGKRRGWGWSGTVDGFNLSII